jgi:MHC class I antigen
VDARNQLRSSERALRALEEQGVVTHAFNPSTREAEAGRFLSSRPAWSTK